MGSESEGTVKGSGFKNLHIVVVLMGYVGGVHLFCERRRLSIGCLLVARFVVIDVLYVTKLLVRLEHITKYYYLKERQNISS